jgi:hypothetical protein
MGGDSQPRGDVKGVGNGRGEADEAKGVAKRRGDVPHARHDDLRGGGGKGRTGGSLIRE